MSPSKRRGAMGEAERGRESPVSREQYATLYARYLDPVYRYCFRRLGNEPAAQDATSQVFYQALANLAQFRGDSFAAWLFSIAHHVVADTFRRQRPTQSLDQVTGLVDKAPTPEAMALIGDEACQIQQLLAQLPTDQRRVVELRLAGLSGSEIAQALGRSLGAVKMLQFRAAARLRELLDGRSKSEEVRDGRA